MPANNNPIEIARFLETRWYEKSGLATTLAFTTIVEGTLLSTGGASWKETTLVLVVSWIAVVTAWWFTAKRIPKTPKGMVGFLVSIECTDDKESEKLREDFVVPLRQLIKSGKTGGDFHFIQLPQHQARKIIDHDDAKALAARTGAHFILYGRVRLREFEGKEHHIINLDGVVSHKPIPSAASDILAREFSLLPRRIQTPTDNDYLTLEFTSEWTEKVATYIIGIAAACSGDFDYAETLFRDVQRRLNGKDKKFPIYLELAKRIPIRLSELHEVRAEESLLKWYESCDDADIDEFGSHLEKVDKSRRNEPKVVTFSAVYAFLKNRDVDAAKAFLKKLKKKEFGGIWNYNMAFLCGYERDLVGAIRHYRSAIGYEVKPDIITQVEDFICLFLKLEPGNYQLFHCLGFFYWKVKGDLISAETAFNNFLNTGDKNEFIKERELAAKWLEEIKQAQNEE